ncbi:hypothetical protein [Chamaesiphon sp. VAR_69_metabat_338]|nr:hypothetical protein [Chamaesiphon sp. VAR_69_metabat_338]
MCVQYIKEGQFGGGWAAIAAANVDRIYYLRLAVGDRVKFL